MHPGELFRRLKLLANRDQAAGELEAEIRFYIEMRAEQIGPGAVRRRFGNSTTLQQQRHAQHESI